MHTFDVSERQALRLLPLCCLCVCVCIHCKGGLFRKQTAVQQQQKLRLFLTECIELDRSKKTH
jgi:hypothetical protein